MKRLILLLFSTIISLDTLAQNEAFVVEQKNGLADIFKVTENIRVKHEKDSVFIVYGDSLGESYARSDIKRIRFNEEKVLVDSVERAALVALYKAQMAIIGPTIPTGVLISQFRSGMEWEDTSIIYH